MFLTQFDPVFLAIDGGGTPTLDLNLRTGTLDPRVTFTRGSSSTAPDATGTLATFADNVPAFAWDPTTLAPLGMQVWESRTNLLLNSATLSTQNVTVTAVAHTLHFTGTGTITLSGASTAGPLVGTGTGEANRVALTFTPSAGTLTLTVTGTVTNAQLEAASNASPYIPTTSAAATRALDVVTMTGSNFSSWFNQAEGTIVIEYMVTGLNSAVGDLFRFSGTAGNFFGIRAGSVITGRDVFGQNGGVTTIDSGSVAVTVNTPYRDILSYKTSTGEYLATLNGTAVSIPTTSVPTITQFALTGLIGKAVARVRYYPRFMTQAQHNAFGTL